MRTYDEAWAAALDEPPFSNGTEGFAWQEQWCGDCVHDAEFRKTGEGGCPLLSIAMCGRTPSEWFEQPWQQIKGRPVGQTAPVLGDTYHCIEYRGEDDGPDPEPRPQPEPPDMDGLFDRPEPAVRMLAHPQLAEVTS